MTAIAERFPLSKIMDFLRRLFIRRQPAAHMPAPVEQVLEPVAMPAPQERVSTLKPAKNRATKQARINPAADLSSLLESLDNVFTSLQLPPSAYSTLPPGEVKGLKAASPLVSRIDWKCDKDSVDTSAGLPATFIVAVDDNLRAPDKEWLYPDFVYGCKAKKVPWNVTRLPGVVYRFGLAWRSEAQQHHWGTFWLAVQQDGSIRVAHELTSVPVRTKHGDYTRREWVASSWRLGEGDPFAPVINVFCKALTLYQQRKQKWNVSVRKGGNRAVFLVNKEDTPTYFKRRDKTALTQQGKRRPIIHFVRAHTQTHGDKVVDIPEHIRGLRSFTWNGYECAITAPAFHVWNSAEFDLASDEFPEDEVPANYRDLQYVASAFADKEDYGQTRKVKRKRA